MPREGIFVPHENFSSDEMNQMENIVESFLADYKREKEIPFDVFVLAEKLGFSLYPQSALERADGMIYVNEKDGSVTGLDKGKIITYNPTKTIEHIRFVIAHELAHYIKERSKTQSPVMFAYREDNHGYSKPWEEQKMDYMAASILVPRQALMEDLKPYIRDGKLTGSITKLTQQFHRKYKVSPMLMLRRIEEISNEWPQG